VNGDLSHGAWPWVALILFGFLPSEIWRVVSIFLSRGIDESSPILGWVRAVATALLAGVVAKLLLSPNGALAAIPLWGRMGSMAAGLGVFWATRRSVFAAVAAAEAALIGVGYWVA
jgi:hypothetical protein